MKKLKAGDIIICMLILSISIVMLSSFRYHAGGDQAIAQIIKDGKVIRTINLDQIDQPVKIEINGKYKNVIIVENRTIRFEESDCPDHTCERIGLISRPGQTAACVPAGVIIKIVGSVEDDTDVIIR